MVNAIIFDLDGTLMDRTKSLQNFLDDQYERYHEYLLDVQREDYINYFLEYDQHGYVSRQQVYRQLFDTLSINYLTPDNLLNDFNQMYPRFAYTFDDTLNTLRRLQSRGYKLGLITNGAVEHQSFIIDSLGFETLMLEELISEEVGLRKPDPAIFQLMLDRLNETPEQAMFVGDHPENDILAAHRVGMQTVFKDNHYFTPPPQEVMDYRIEQLSELLNILDEETI